MVDIYNLCKEAYRIASEKGFHDHDGKFLRNFESRPAAGNAHSECILILSWLAKVSSEVGEAVDAVRDSKTRGDLADELADIVIRVADMSHALNINLDSAIAYKMQKK